MVFVDYLSVMSVLHLEERIFDHFVFQELVQVYGDRCPTYNAVTKWVRESKSGFKSLMVEKNRG